MDCGASQSVTGSLLNTRDVAEKTTNIETRDRHEPAFGVTDSYGQTLTPKCVQYYVPAACREQCTIDPSPIRVISKLSKKKLRAFKSQPRHRKLRNP